MVVHPNPVHLLDAPAANPAVPLTVLLEPNPAPSTPFGGARTFLGERQIQLGVRFKF